MIDPISTPVPSSPASEEADPAPGMPARVDTETLRGWLARSDRPRLIDVRSAAEFSAAHIPGSYNVPLPLLREHRDEFVEPLDEQIVLVCRTDRRAEQAESLLAAAGLTRVHVLSGGLDAWRAGSGQVRLGEGRWDLERQVRFVAGGIVAAGVLTSAVVPQAKWLAGFVGAGLVTAALTDSCVMGSLLAKLPYNRDLDPGVDDVVTALSR